MGIVQVILFTNGNK